MPTFPTNDFGITDHTDPTKVIDFDLTPITGGVGFTRTIDAVDYPGVLVLSDAEHTGGTLKLLFHYGNAGTGPTWQDPLLPDNVLKIVDDGDSSKQLAFQCSGISSTNVRTWAVADYSGMVPVVGDDPPAVAAGSLGKVVLTGQTANIGTTNLTNGALTGGYFLGVYLQCTTADVTAGTITVTIGWTDINGAQTDTSVTHALTSTTNPARAILPIQVSSGEITYAVSNSGAYNSAVYAIGIRIIYLGA